MSKTGLFLVLFSVLASAQEAPPTTDTSKVASIEGVVVNELTKEPIRKVNVSLFKQVKTGSGGGAAYSAITDAAGKFRIENVEPGDYAVVQHKTGFIASRSNYGPSARLLKLGASQSLTGLRYTLVPQGIVSGRVVDDEGEPVQNISVSLLRSGYDRGSSRVYSNSRPQSTNDRGEFRFTEVQPGRYFLQADVQRMAAMTGGAVTAQPTAPGVPRTAFVNTFYPGASEIAQATRIEVQAGQELAGRDIALRKDKVVRVTGKVVSASGAPPKQAFVTLLRSDPPMSSGSPTAFAPVDENGRFAANNVPPGQYKVRAMRGDVSDWQSGETSVDVGDGGADDVVVQLQSALEAKGAFVLEDSERKDFDFSGKQVMLQATDGETSGFAFGQCKADGTFSIAQLTPGHFTLEVNSAGPDEGYVKAILAGTEDVFGKEVDANAIAAAGLKIVIRLDSASLGGTVEIPDERKAFLRSPYVVLLPADAQLRKTSRRNVAPLNQENGFSLKSLRPGDYIAFAFEELDYASLEDPEVFAAIESKGTAVSLAANESKNLSLKILPWPEQFADRIQ